MVGTIFLWLYWPSFNGIFPNADFTDSTVFGFSQTRAFLNTVLSLCSCTIATLSMSFYVEGGNHIDMVHIQNSTLAGGVAVGAAANLYLTPGGAMIVGLVSAILSVLGFKYISPFIEDKFKVYDSCGINNLHGMPGILGGIVSAIAIGLASNAKYPNPDDSFYYNTFSKQAAYQVIGILVTLCIAIITGCCGGMWGVLSVGLFASSENIKFAGYNDILVNATKGYRLSIQMFAVFIIILWITVWIGGFNIFMFKLIKYITCSKRC